MLSKTFARSALATALIFTFGACSDSSSGPDFDGTATTEDTKSMGNDAADYATEIVDGMNFGSPQVFLFVSGAVARAEAAHPHASRSPFGALIHSGVISMPGLVAAPGAPIQFSAAPGCSVESYGTDDGPFDPYDGNGNLVPDDYGVKYTCVTFDSSNVENIITQWNRIEISVKENTAVLHGFTAKMMYQNNWTDQEGHEMGDRIDGTEVHQIRVDGVTAHSSYREREWSTSDGETEEWVYGEENQATFDPDSAIAQPLPSGYLDFTGKRYYYETDGTSLSFTIDTPTPLHYSAACLNDGIEPPFSSGVIRGRLNGNSNSASFTVTFADCDDYTVTTENTDDPVPAVAVRR